MKVVVLVQNGHVTQVLMSHPLINVEVISVDTHCRQCEIQARDLVIRRQADKQTYPYIGFTTPTGYCEHCRDCGKPTGEGGDGYDGRCGSCADKADSISGPVRPDSAAA